jgi:NAD-dependent deacetylase
MSKKRLIVFTGAGISAESGIKTFRDSGGLWEQYKIEDVATFSAWTNNRERVLKFYDQRRRQVMDAQPNAAHYSIAQLEKNFDVQIITQNVDDLHERAGSKNVLHLHGEIMKARSTVDPTLIYSIDCSELKPDAKCEKGSILRPHIVWFGEMVPEMENAYLMAAEADLFVVIGTSLNVYPAAGILNFVLPQTPKWLIDPGDFDLDLVKGLNLIKKTAVHGVKDLEGALQRYL